MATHLMEAGAIIAIAKQLSKEGLLVATTTITLNHTTSRMSSLPNEDSTRCRSPEKIHMMTRPLPQLQELPVAVA